MQSKLQNDMYKIINFIHKMPETTPNIKEFGNMLKALGPDITMVSSYQYPTEVLHMNIAGEVFRASTLKSALLNCILDIAPNLLYEGYFDFQGTILKLHTPLLMAIKNRSASMVNAVLSNSIFTSYIDKNIEDSCYQLFIAYMWALRWYDETKSENAMSMVAKRERLNMTGIPAMLQDQKEILETLLKKCKEAMKIASFKGHITLPKTIVKILLRGDIIGKSFILYKKPDLLKLQVENTFNICKAFYAEDAELNVAMRDGLLVSNDVIMRLIELRQFIDEEETDKNVEAFQKSLSALHKDLGPQLFKEFLLISGRSESADNSSTTSNLSNTSLSDFASVNQKLKFARCIRINIAPITLTQTMICGIAFEKAKVDAKLLQQTALSGTNTPSNQKALSSTCTTSLVPKEFKISCMILAAICSKIPDTSNEHKGRGM